MTENVISSISYFITVLDTELNWIEFWSFCILKLIIKSDILLFSIRIILWSLEWKLIYLWKQNLWCHSRNPCRHIFLVELYPFHPCDQLQILYFRYIVWNSPRVSCKGGSLIPEMVLDVSKLLVWGLCGIYEILFVLYWTLWTK